MFLRNYHNIFWIEGMGFSHPLLAGRMIPLNALGMLAFAILWEAIRRNPLPPFSEASRVEPQGIPGGARARQDVCPGSPGFSPPIMFSSGFEGRSPCQGRKTML